MAVLLIVLSFLSAVVCYREHLHIGVGILPALLKEPVKSVLGWFLEMLRRDCSWWSGASSWCRRPGTRASRIPYRHRRHDLSADSDRRRAHRLFVIERLLTQRFFQEPAPETVGQVAME